MSKTNPIRVGIAGAAGYTGGELLRILIHHPNTEIVFAHSKSSAGKPLHSVHSDLLGDTDILFADTFRFDAIDVLFLCMGHGESSTFLKENTVPAGVKIIDLANDFRLTGDHGFVYGLPELNRDIIKSANKIANPGCFATCIQLGLLPLAKAGLLQGEIHINATTGSTGAGQKPVTTTHFSWRNANLSIYKAFTHQHMAEIGQSLSQLQSNYNKQMFFIPERGAFARGILAAEVVDYSGSIDEAYQLYTNYYAAHPFTHVSREPVDLKQVVNTNKCLISLEKYEGKLLITSIIDNLTKGASGQAVQNMNLIFGLDETTGLKLKSVGY